MKAQEQFAMLMRDGVDTAMRVFSVSMGGSEKIGELITDYGARCLADNGANLRLVAQGGDLRTAAEQWPDLYQAHVERFLETSRQFLEITAATQTEICRLMDARAQAMGRSFAAAAEEMRRAAAQQGDVLTALRTIGERAAATDPQARSPRRTRETA